MTTEELEALKKREEREGIEEAMLREGYGWGLRDAMMAGRWVGLEAGVRNQGRDDRRKRKRRATEWAEGRKGRIVA